MPLHIRVVGGHWGGALTTDVLTVARSTSDAFGSLPADLECSVVVEPTPSEMDDPITLSTPNASDEIIVRLNVRGNLWARLAYQFAHELCHVFADPTSWVPDHLAWIEEALCETASLFALRSMENTWVAKPPHPHWSDYARALSDYAADRVSDPRHSLPPQASVSQWLAEKLPLLQADANRREDNTIIAKELLPIFESDCTAWAVVPHLHRAPRPPQGSLAEFARAWRQVCPPRHRRSVTRIAAALGVQPGR